jgi:hypothetical protein
MMNLNQRVADLERRYGEPGRFVRIIVEEHPQLITVVAWQDPDGTLSLKKRYIGVDLDQVC